MTLRPDDWEAWIAGAYFRGYALLKQRRLQEADRLFEELQHDADEHIPQAALTSRIRRLHGEVLLGLNDARGRELIQRVLKDLGGVNAYIDKEDKERARLASDLCRSLTAIGEHDQAIELMTNVCRRELRDPELAALRWSNLASWHNQRAVARRAAGNLKGARDDLDRAAENIARAIERREDLRTKLLHDQSLERRECKAIELSIRIERSAVARIDLDEEIKELHALLNETPDFEQAPETPLQLAYRIGRLGVAHMRTHATGPRKKANLLRGHAYLRYAWEYSRNALLRPWLALDLCEALQASRKTDEVRAIAEASLTRLGPACAPDYPPKLRLSEYLDGQGRPDARQSRPTKRPSPESDPVA